MVAVATLAYRDLVAAADLAARRGIRVQESVVIRVHRVIRESVDSRAIQDYRDIPVIRVTQESADIRD